jgi:hypothetical protein
VSLSNKVHSNMRCVLGLLTLLLTLVAFGPSTALASGVWSAPTNIDSVGYSTIASVSCPSATFCVAVDDVGDALTYNGTSWSAPTKIHGPGDNGQSVSCTSPTFCAEVGNCS